MEDALASLLRQHRCFQRWSFEVDPAATSWRLPGSYQYTAALHVDILPSERDEFRHRETRPLEELHGLGEACRERRVERGEVCAAWESHAGPRAARKPHSARRSRVEAGVREYLREQTDAAVDRRAGESRRGLLVHPRLHITRRDATQIVPAERGDEDARASLIHRPRVLRRIQPRREVLARSALDTHPLRLAIDHQPVRHAARRHLAQRPVSAELRLAQRLERAEMPLLRVRRRLEDDVEARLPVSRHATPDPYRHRLDSILARRLIMPQKPHGYDDRLKPPRSDAAPHTRPLAGTSSAHRRGARGSREHASGPGQGSLRAVRTAEGSA
jgi:hypothetical protein